MYNNYSNDCSKYSDYAEWLRLSDILNDWCKADRTCREVKELAILGACENGEIEYTRSDGKTFDDPVIDLQGRGILLINKNSFNEWKNRIEQKNTTPIKTATKTNLLDFVNSVDAGYISIGDAIDAIHKHIGLDQDVNKAVQVLNLAIGKVFSPPRIYKKDDFKGWLPVILKNQYSGDFLEAPNPHNQAKLEIIHYLINKNMEERRQQELDDDLPFSTHLGEKKTSNFAFKKSELLAVLQEIDSNFSFANGEIHQHDCLDKTSVESNTAINNLPHHIKVLAMNDYFTVIESACFISLDEPEKIQAYIDSGDFTYNAWNYGGHIQAVKVIEGAIKAKKLDIDNDGVIPRASLQKFLFDRNNVIIGFNDNLPIQEPIGCGNPTIQQTEPTIENLNAEIARLKQEMVSKDQTIAELQQKNGSLVAENAINDIEISLKNSELLFIAVLLKKLQSAITTKRHKSQNAILQSIETEYGVGSGLSKSTTDKIMKKANGIYKSLITNKMQ